MRSLALTGTLALASAMVGCHSSSPTGEPTVPLVDAAVQLSRCTTPDISPEGGITGPSYLTTVTLGGSQAFQMIVDTGSAQLVVASSSCTQCAGVSPLYTPGPSATDLGQTALVAYGGLGDQAKGEVFSDTAQVGRAPSVPIDLLAINQQTNVFTAFPPCDSFQGVLGLGPPFGTTGDYFPQLVSVGGVPNVFAVSLCDSGGSLWLGGYDPSATTGAPQYTPMADAYWYTVEITGIAVGGAAVDLPARTSGWAIVDTGAPILELPQPMFQAAVAAIAKSTRFQALFGDASWFTNAPSCAAAGVSAAEIDSTLPSLALVLGSNPAITVEAPATASYLQPQPADGGTSWCPALYGGPAIDVPDAAPPGSDPIGYIGTPFLRSSVVIFDLQNERVGFAPHRCP